MVLAVPSVNPLTSPGKSYYLGIGAGRTTGFFDRYLDDPHFPGENKKNHSVWAWETSITLLTGHPITWWDTAGPVTYQRKKMFGEVWTQSWTKILLEVIRMYTYVCWTRHIPFMCHRSIVRGNFRAWAFTKSLLRSHSVTIRWNGGNSVPPVLTSSSIFWAWRDECCCSKRDDRIKGQR